MIECCEIRCEMFEGEGAGSVAVAIPSIGFPFNIFSSRAIISNGPHGVTLNERQRQ